MAALEEVDFHGADRFGKCGTILSGGLMHPAHDLGPHFHLFMFMASCPSLHQHAATTAQEAKRHAQFALQATGAGGKFDPRRIQAVRRVRSERKFHFLSRR
ncbi:hypothetical protein [Ruegeria intermedia]|uniref:hypothetical protein n=1 Tax=Ruegeria intermedia TaxID=996115 RepID=UPI00122D3101|nr:hypothetical protein [Ruegeria intermedia]